jgi:hypothetical protein
MMAFLLEPELAFSVTAENEGLAEIAAVSGADDTLRIGS